MAGQVHRASGGRSARRAAHPEMAERWRAGGWEANTRGGRDAPRGKCLALAGQRVPPLCVRSVGPGMASKACSRGGHRGAFCGRYRAWLPEEIGCRPVSGGTQRENAEVQPGAASREDAAAGIRSVCDRKPAKAWTRETGDVQLSRLYAHLHKEEE